GQSVWTFVRQRGGDQVIGQILDSVPGVGVERAFRRDLGVSFEELGDEWREGVQTRPRPAGAAGDRPRQRAAARVTKERSVGGILLAPSLSSDGKTIAFLSNGSLRRGQVFIDLWLADAESGKRIRRVVRSTFDPSFEELRVLYSQ